MAALVMRVFEAALVCDGDTRRAGDALEPLQSALVWFGETPHRTAGKDGQASTVPTL